MLTIHRSNRLEILADRLTEILRKPVEDPFCPEIILVQERGTSRWLSLEIARRLGVASNLRFRFPAAYLWELINAALPDVPEESPFDPEVMTWRIHQLLAAPRKTPAWKPLRRWLGENEDGRRFELARRIAASFDRYLVYRPEWPEAWQRRKSIGLGPDEEWQAELWRGLAKGIPQAGGHPRARFLDLLHKGTLPSGILPPRLFLFGLSDLAPAYAEVLHAVASRADVHVFLTSPCRAGSGTDGVHPLLAKWGGQGWQFEAQLVAGGGAAAGAWSEPKADTLLGHLQAGLLDDRPLPAEPRPVGKDDVSLQIHACHGPRRELEVLHDRLLDLFKCFPDLTPGEVGILTPDPETYGPIAEAVFATAEPGIPLEVAERGEVAGPVSRAFLGFLDLPGSRWEASRLLTLLENPAVARRFELGTEDAGRIRRWLDEAGIRWGLDAGQRKGLGLPATGEHTWGTGLDRLLMGFALEGDETSLAGGILPVLGVEGEAARTLGRLVAILDTLREAAARAGERHPPGEWVSFLADLLDGLLKVEGRDEEAELNAVRSFLGNLESTAERAGYGGAVPLDVVRSLARSALGTGGAGRFPSGKVSFGAFRPGRPLPFRVLCLVGMNDNAFPGSDQHPGFDLIAAPLQLGDRDRRREDLGMFLGAVASAGDALLITFTGRGIQDNHLIPPAVPVAELLEYVERMTGKPTGSVLVEHPLQPFSRRYFDGSDERLFSFNKEMCEACGAEKKSRLDPRPLVTDLLSEPPGALLTIGLEDLVRFYRAPARAFLRLRLGIFLPDDETVPDDREPFTLKEDFADVNLRRRMVRALARGREMADIVAAETVRGILPPGKPGRLILREEATRAGELFGKLESRLVVEPLPPVPLDLERAGVRLTGSLREVRPDGLLVWDAGKIRPHLELELWIRFLALCVAHPAGVDLRAVLVAEDTSRTLEGVQEPESHLKTLLEGYARGLREPLPFFPRCSLEAAKELVYGKDEGAARRAARGEWQPWDERSGEGAKPWNELAFRDTDPLAGDGFILWARRIGIPLREALAVKKP